MTAETIIGATTTNTYTQHHMRQN